MKLKQAVRNATVGNAFSVPYLLGQPLSIEWKGLFVDADLKAVQALPRTTEAGGRALLFTQLSALQGSALEHKLFEDAFGVDSISADKVAALANTGDPAVPILAIDQSNVSTILPTLPFDDNVKQDITEAVNQNSAFRNPKLVMRTGPASATSRKTSRPAKRGTCSRAASRAA